MKPTFEDMMFKGPTSGPKFPSPSSVRKFTVLEIAAKGTFSARFNICSAQGRENVAFHVTFHR